MSRDPIDDPALAPLLRALTAPADERELDGLDGAVRSFRAAQVSSPPPSSRRASMIFTLAGAKLGATLAALAVGVGGVATVAYVSASTPSGATDAHSTVAASPTTVDADKGKAAEAPAFRNLAAAAGGADKVEAWCAALPPVGSESTGQPGDHPTGKPTTVPTGKPSTVPSGKPATVLPTVPSEKPTTTGKPTTVAPTTHPTGRP